MGFKYLNIQRGDKNGFVAKRMIDVRAYIRSFVLLLAFVTILSACSKKTSPGSSSGAVSGEYNQSLFNLTLLEGERQKMLGNSGEAINYFEQALKINPVSDGAAYEISRISFGIGDLDNAIKYGSLALEIDGKNKWYLNHLATLYLTKGRMDSVKVVFERIIAIFPEDEETLFNLGGLYLETGEANKAEAIFTKLRSEYGDNDQIVIALLNSLNQQNKRDESEKLLIKMIENNSDNSTFLGMLAENYRKYGDPEKAIDIYQELFDKDPDNPLLYLSYIDFMIEEEAYEDLGNIVDQALLNDSIDKESKIAILVNLSKSEAYIKDYKERLILSAFLFEASYKGDVDAIYAVALVYGAVGDKENEIIKLLQRAEAGGKNYAYWEELLIKINDSGDMEGLYMISERVSKEFNIYPLPKLFLAFAATDRGEYDLALTELGKVRILVNEQKEFMMQILSLEADIYYRKADYSKSFGLFEQALEIGPDDPMILNNYAYFISEQDGDLKRAEQLIAKCLSIERNETYLDTYAWVLYKLGKYKKAESVMKEIFQSEVNDSELLEHFAYIKRARGDCKEAIRLWNLSFKADNSKSYLIDEIEKCTEGK